MARYKRPWWLLVNKPAGLKTTVREENRPNERLFIVRGEPVIIGLAWLTWGPAAAVLAVAGMALLTVVLDIRDQAMAVRAAVIAAFLLLPALAWGVVTLILTRLSAPHLEAERQADTQIRYIRLDLARRELGLSSGPETEEIRLPLAAIRRFRVTTPIGATGGQSLLLAAETDTGPVILLDERLGSRAVKIDLAEILNGALNTGDPAEPEAGEAAGTLPSG